MTTKTEKSIRFMVPVKLHTDFKMKCVKDDISMQDKLLELMQKYVAEIPR